MQISRFLFQRMVDLFMANTPLLTVATPNEVKIQPVNVNFTPSLDIALGDVPAQGAPLAVTQVKVFTDAPANSFNYPLEDGRVGRLPLEQDRMLFTAGGGTFPFTITGVRLVSADGLTLLATEKLPAPVQYTASGQAFKCPGLEFHFPASMVR